MVFEKRNGILPLFIVHTYSAWHLPSRHLCLNEWVQEYPIENHHLSPPPQTIKKNSSCLVALLFYLVQNFGVISDFSLLHYCPYPGTAYNTINIGLFPFDMSSNLFPSTLSPLSHCDSLLTSLLPLTFPVSVFQISEVTVHFWICCTLVENHWYQRRGRENREANH